jgi:hypothetical protein
VKARYRPRLNIAIPNPASDRMEMDFRTMAGISKFHLQDNASKSNQTFIKSPRWHNMPLW